MGTVWVADDLEGMRRVAIKLLRPELAKSPEVRARFAAEAELLARIKSPHVPEVYEHGTLGDGTPFIVMELMAGRDLDAYLAAHGPLSLRATARLVSHVVAALEAAHREGVVHRDVKAENIFIQGDGECLEAKLFDFGIAKAVSSRQQTQVGAILGTPGYMSPEQLESARTADHRADYWSLGVVAYVALTNTLPFDGDTLEAIARAMQGRFAPPSLLRTGLSRDVDAWFEKALHKDPAARFQTASELASSLVAIALGDHRSAREELPGMSRSLRSGEEARLLRLALTQTRPGVGGSSRRAAVLRACGVAGVLLLLASISVAEGQTWLQRASGGWLQAKNLVSSHPAAALVPVAETHSSAVVQDGALPTSPSTPPPVAPPTASQEESAPPVTTAHAERRPLSPPSRSRRSMPVPREYDESELARLAQALDAASLREASGLPRLDDAARRLSPAVAPPSGAPPDAGTSDVPGIAKLSAAFGDSRD
jgi:eukaryotic-like serine/threonine-protein kinase